MKLLKFTPLKTNMSPENQWLVQMYVLLKYSLLRGHSLVFRGVLTTFLWPTLKIPTTQSSSKPNTVPNGSRVLFSLLKRPKLQKSHLQLLSIIWTTSKISTATFKHRKKKRGKNMCTYIYIYIYLYDIYK